MQEASRVHRGQRTWLRKILLEDGVRVESGNSRDGRAEQGAQERSHPSLSAFLLFSRRCDWAGGYGQEQ